MPLLVGAGSVILAVCAQLWLWGLVSGEAFNWEQEGELIILMVTSAVLLFPISILTLAAASLSRAVRSRG